MNPRYSMVFTFMGREFGKIPRSNAALQSFRRAVGRLFDQLHFQLGSMMMSVFSEINPHDSQAWHSLGKCYDVLKIAPFSIYYFTKAQKVNPYDHRMLVSLADAYEKLEKYDNALKCYERAKSMDHAESSTTFHVGRLHKRLGNIAQAVAAYEEFLRIDPGAIDDEATVHVYLTLGNFYKDRGRLDEAAACAYKCLDLTGQVSATQVLL